MSVRHVLSLTEFSLDELLMLIRRARELKRMHREHVLHQPLKGRVLGMIFEKASTRTRVSFEAGMLQLGGGAIFLSSRDTQLGRGEPIEDTAKVLSRMVDAVMIRTHAHEPLERFAANSSVPVINGLSDKFHPCQLLADMQTFFELRGDIRGRTVAWIGDGNNVCNSYVNAAALFDFKLRICSPQGFHPAPELLAVAGDRVTLLSDPREAAQGADLVTTDVWASMGKEAEQDKRLQAFQAYTVSPAVLAEAAPDALFMHCLPAHRGEEVAAEVIDGPQSVVWDQAENRLHAQKALLEFLLLGPDAVA